MNEPKKSKEELAKLHKYSGWPAPEHDEPKEEPSRKRGPGRPKQHHETDASE
jgi:hypothetical protein